MLHCKTIIEKRSNLVLDFQGQALAANPKLYRNCELLAPYSEATVSLFDLTPQVEIADSMQTLFRGNSLASKIMAYCFKIYGQGYLRELLNPLITDMFVAERQGIAYEVDPARY